MFETDYNALVTIDELCEMLMIGKTNAYRLLNSNEIHAFKIGSHWKIPRESVSNYVKKNSGLSS